MVNSANNEQRNCNAQKNDRKGIPVIGWIADLYPVWYPKIPSLYSLEMCRYIDYNYPTLNGIDCVIATSPQSTPVVERDIQVPTQVMCLDGVVLTSELNENEQEN